MTEIKARIRVGPDHAISGTAPDAVPPGEHEVAFTLVEPPRSEPQLPGKPFTMKDFPLHDEPWDDSISLRREDMYDDDGRLR